MMNDIAYLFTTRELFDTDPEYDGDTSKVPPPGRLICNSLIAKLGEDGFSFNYDEVPEDYWEHSDWHFSGTWNGKEYSFVVQTNCAHEPPLKVAVSVYRRLGCLAGLIGKTASVEPEVERFIGEFAESIADEAGLSRMSQDDAATEIWED